MLKLTSSNGNMWELPISLLIKMCKTYVYKNKIYIQFINNTNNNILGEYPIELPMFSINFSKIYLSLESEF